MKKVRTLGDVQLGDIVLGFLKTGYPIHMEVTSIRMPGRIVRGPRVFNTWKQRRTKKQYELPLKQVKGVLRRKGIPI